jgi:hypothetical protein
MSEVVGKWIIVMQDEMPDDMRNSQDWRTLLPLAAGTGRKKEAKRLKIIMQWMWVDVLPPMQPQADKYGYGSQWAEMCKKRTEEAAYAAYASANAYAKSAANAANAYANAANAAYAAYAAANAADAANAANAYAAAKAADAATYATAKAATDATDAATYAANAAATDATNVKNWGKINPCAILKKLINA